MSAPSGDGQLPQEDYVFLDAPEAAPCDRSWNNGAASPLETEVEETSFVTSLRAQLAATGGTEEETHRPELEHPSGIDLSGRQAREAALKRAKQDGGPTPTAAASSGVPPGGAAAAAAAAAGRGDDGDEAPAAAALADSNEEAMSDDQFGSDGGQVSDYDSDYEMEDDSDSDGKVGDPATKDAAKADTEVFDEGSDGMFARVEAPSSTLLRIWVCVKAWRLFEGLTHTTAVEALGLDPAKGVMVMITTNQHYLASGERPKVKWARQVDMDKVDRADMSADGSIGEIFPLQGTLCRKLEEELALFCSGTADREAAAAAAAGSDVSGRDDSEGCTENGHGELSRDGGDAAAPPPPPPPPTGEVDGAKRAVVGGGGAELDSSAIRFAIETIRESTGVSAELAAYALLVSKYDEQVAQLNLVDEDLRPVLEEDFEKFSRLQELFPPARENNVLDAIVAHPKRLPRQQRFLRAVDTGKPPAPDSSLRRVALERLAETNPLVRVALAMTNKLRNANKRCLVCDDKIEGFLPAVPIVCPKEFCRWRSEQMGCGTDVESQVVRKGDTVNLLIDLFWMAMTDSRWDLAFPDTVQCGPELVFKRADGTNDVDKVREVLSAVPSVADMQRCIERKRKNLAGGISSPPSAEADNAWVAAAAANAAANAAAANVSADAAAAAAVAALAEKENAIAAAACAIPVVRGGGATAVHGRRTIHEERVARAAAACAVAKAHAANAAAAAAAASSRATAAGALADGLAPSWGVSSHAAGAAPPPPGQGGNASGVPSLESALSERNPATYRLLRWLLSANRAHLRPLQEWELISEIACDKQFMLVTGTAEREARFQKMKQEAAAAGGGTGSFFAFHGSGPGNWHGILHLGLKNMSGSKWMSSGAAMGNGIYMADDLSVSAGYAGARGGRNGGGGHWPQSATGAGKTPVIVAVCEVIDRKEFKANGHRAHRQGYYVVPDEEAVAARFLLINPSDPKGGIKACGLTINLRT